jgi:hypothetical protein
MCLTMLQCQSHERATAGSICVWCAVALHNRGAKQTQPFNALSATAAKLLMKESAASCRHKLYEMGKTTTEHATHALGKMRQLYRMDNLKWSQHSSPSQPGGSRRCHTHCLIARPALLLKLFSAEPTHSNYTARSSAAMPGDFCQQQYALQRTPDSPATTLITWKWSQHSSPSQPGGIADAAAFIAS